MAVNKLMRFEDAASMAFVESVLQSHGIEYHISQRHYPSIDGSHLHVADEDVDATCDLLMEIGFREKILSPYNKRQRK